MPRGITTPSWVDGTDPKGKEEIFFIIDDVPNRRPRGSPYSLPVLITLVTNKPHWEGNL